MVTNIDNNNIINISNSILSIIMITRHEYKASILSIARHDTNTKRNLADSFAAVGADRVASTDNGGQFAKVRVDDLFCLDCHPSPPERCSGGAPSRPFESRFSRSRPAHCLSPHPAPFTSFLPSPVFRGPPQRWCLSLLGLDCPLLYVIRLTGVRASSKI